MAVTVIVILVVVVVVVIVVVVAVVVYKNPFLMFRNVKCQNYHIKDCI